MARQLRMVRPNLRHLPELELPDSYSIRTYREGDEVHWANIISDSFGGQQRTARDAQAEIIGRNVFKPDGLYFVTHQGIPVGTACAWRQSVEETQVGYVHMVGVVTEHTGHKLGKWISLAVLHYFRDHRFISAMLDTDDFRLPAIKTYLNLGFIPVYVERSQPRRWQDVFEKLELPSMTEEITRLRQTLPSELWDKVSR